MTKIETALDSLIRDIGMFYKADAWHFITVNGIDLGEGKIELQWIFSRYGVKDEVVVYYLISDYETPIPSIVGLIPSAIMGEREIVDLFGLKIDNIEHGLYLDEDSLPHPLRRES